MKMYPALNYTACLEAIANTKVKRFKGFIEQNPSYGY
jgi:hypothetical protein